MLFDQTCPFEWNSTTALLSDGIAYHIHTARLCARRCELRSENAIGHGLAAVDRTGRCGNEFGRNIHERVRLGQVASQGRDEFRRLTDAIDDAYPLAECGLGSRRRFFAIRFEIALERVELLAVDFFRLIPRGNGH